MRLTAFEFRRHKCVAERRDERSRGIYPTDGEITESRRRGATLEDEGQGSSQKEVFERRYATRYAVDTHRGLKATATFGQSLRDLEGIKDRIF